jgi:ABC-type uncharacterized transport system involved in gliding motility auxiliary subunit
VNGRRKGVQEALFHLLLLAAAMVFAWLSVRHVATWDWSGDRRNSLAAESRALLQRLQAPLHFTSYAPDQPRLRRRILQLLERYRRARPQAVEIRFVDPELHPGQARAAGVELAGELVLEYQGRTERLQTLSEGHIGNALLRLLERPERWIGALTGHGERSLQGQANHDLGLFGAALEQRGFRVQPLDLTRTAALPDNLGLLVLADPRTALLPGEVQRLRSYLREGGALLWLREPGAPAPDLEPLGEDLGVRPLPGRIVDADVRELGVDDPTVALVPSYPDHPATGGLSALSLFPGAAALEPLPGGSWHPMTLLATRGRSWNETGRVRGPVSRDAQAGERAGPLTLGLALERALATPSGERHQRALVVGDADFLANSFLANAGNRELGLRLVRWLMQQDELLHIPPPQRADTELRITRSMALVLGGGTLILLPLVLLSTGLWIHWRRGRY